MQTMLVSIISLLITLLSAGVALGGTTTIRWHGHAAVEIVTPAQKRLMVDPWLSNPANPAVKEGRDPVAAVAGLDYILITHAHFDHIGDAVPLAQKTGARLVAVFELGEAMKKLLGFPAEQMGYDTLMNIGGAISLADGEITVAMTPAVHSSGLSNPLAAEKDPPFAYAGNPVGFVIKIKEGPVIYHAGDTAYFGDMEEIGNTYHPDVALLPVGDHFTMGPQAAARTARAVKAGLAVPFHYGTFPVLAPDADAFAAALQGSGIAVRVLDPGEALVFEGNRLQER